MTSKRSLLLQWAQHGLIAPDKFADALAMADITPSPKDWRQFLDRLLLWCGALFLATGVIFFIAFNWEALGHYAKFGLVEALIVLALIVYWKLGSDSLAGKVTLLATAILLGGLLALFGQTYQTGADPWQLFAVWAALITPWVLLSRFPVLWLFWLTLLNVALVLYFQVFHGVFGLLFSTETMLLALFVLNTLALAVWELMARRLSWFNERWTVRPLAYASGVTITLLMLYSIFEAHRFNNAVIYLLWLAGFYFFYRYIIRDLFMLSGMCLSVIVVVTSLLSKQLLHGDYAGGFLLIALIIIGMASGSAMWLKRIHQES